MTVPKNQHYVPRFILRNFLADKAKEQVSVYDKHTDKAFPVSIQKIMAENRFHDFVFQDWAVSFEPVMTKFEEMVLPVYQRIIETRRLDKSPEEQAALAFLVALQFARTKASRYRLGEVERKVTQKVQSMGLKMEDIEGWEPLTEDTLKRVDLLGIRDALPDFTAAISDKDFSLAAPSPGRTFYLGDNPVCLHNARPADFFGNIGLAVPGIEIYLPLSSDLLLCAWCPSILAQMRDARNASLKQTRSQLLGLVIEGKITAERMRAELEPLLALEKPIDDLLETVAAGTPHTAEAVNMDFYNCLQTANAYRYVVCQNSDFDLAKRHNKAFPELRKGHEFKIS